MKTLKITISGQYQSSNSSFEGTKKQVLNFLRTEAKRMRRESRTSRHLDDSVHSIPEQKHPSKLVTIASFKLNDMRMEDIIKLINNHGVLKYTVK